MLPIERQGRIRELVCKKQYVKISELSADLGVSEMTIHRDIKPLIEDGLIHKTFGGIALVVQEANQDVNILADICIYCARTVNERLAYRLILSNGRIENTCCAHCGLLRHLQLEDEVQQAICQDFLKQTTISAGLASYVLDTSIDINCCQPQVLTFELRQHADMFVKGFGGAVYSFAEARQIILERMNALSNTSCCQRQES